MKWNALKTNNNAYQFKNRRFLLFYNVIHFTKKYWGCKVPGTFVVNSLSPSKRPKLINRAEND